jgi:CBS domain-containing protein
LRSALSSWATLAEEFTKSHGKKVYEVMSEHMITATEETPLAEIAAILERYRIKRVPIPWHGKLVGIISRSNLVQALASKRGVAAEDVDKSHSIRLELLSRLGKQTWTDVGSRNVIVIDGKVHLWGLIGSESERKALIALAKEVPGVTEVIDAYK